MKTLRFMKALTLTITVSMASNCFAGALEMLNQDLQAGIKTLPRETRLYHYFKFNERYLMGKPLEKTKYKNSDSRNDFANSYVKGSALSFWDYKIYNTSLANSGMGLYLAIDPFASSPTAASDTGYDFGSTMLEVTLNPGTKYLDLMKDIHLSEETISAIITETSMTDEDANQLLRPRLEPKGKVSHKGFARDTLQNMAASNNVAFRSMVHEIFSRNNIAMTEYGWQAATSSFCGSTLPHRSALVFVAKGALAESVIKSATVVYFEPAKVEFDLVESEALFRNSKLVSVLKPLREQEKNYQSISKNADRAKNNGDIATSKQLSAQLPDIISSIQATISSVYPDPAEIDELRSKTFECVK